MNFLLCWKQLDAPGSIQAGAENVAAPTWLHLLADWSLADRHLHIAGLEKSVDGKFRRWVGLEVNMQISHKLVTD
jgi:hypothetical protein